MADDHLLFRVSGNEFKSVIPFPPEPVILGVIMYLRFGWVLGSVGLFQTLIIVTIATAVTFTTSLSYIDIVYTAIALRRNIIIVKEAAPPVPGTVNGTNSGRIDVWWDKESENAGRLLAIAFMMHSSHSWHKYRLHINVILTAGTEEAGVKRRINTNFGKMRIKAKVAIFENRENKGHFDIINLVSSDADFILLGFHSPKDSTGKDACQRYFEGLITKVGPLPATAPVMAREEINFDRLFVE